jgi:hypothetical protein
LPLWSSQCRARNRARARDANRRQNKRLSEMPADSIAAATTKMGPRSRPAGSSPVRLHHFRKHTEGDHGRSWHVAAQNERGDMSEAGKSGRRILTTYLAVLFARRQARGDFGPRYSRGAPLIRAPPPGPCPHGGGGLPASSSRSQLLQLRLCRASQNNAWL